MGAEHSHALYHHGHTLVHRLAPEAKVAATFAFVLAVATTPRHAVWAFGVHFFAIAAVVVLARLPVRFVIARLTVIVPFMLFAALIPFVGGGEQTEVLGMSLSRVGLWAAFNVVAKAGIGATASIVLAGTTQQSQILVGLGRLGVPKTLVMIATFMLRYLELLADELTRMRTAMVSRAHDPRWLWQARPMASAAGALFVRSYERGERIHSAMLSRGFAGTMPELAPEHATRRDWLTAAALPVIAAATTIAGLLVSR